MLAEGWHRCIRICGISTPASVPRDKSMSLFPEEWKDYAFAGGKYSIRFVEARFDPARMNDACMRYIRNSNRIVAAGTPRDESQRISTIAHRPDIQKWWGSDTGILSESEKSIRFHNLCQSERSLCQNCTDLYLNITAVC